MLSRNVLGRGVGSALWITRIDGHYTYTYDIRRARAGLAETRWSR
jgi:hypothetical protein